MYASRVKMPALMTATVAMEASVPLKCIDYDYDVLDRKGTDLSL